MQLRCRHRSATRIAALIGVGVVAVACATTPATSPRSVTADPTSAPSSSHPAPPLMPSSSPSIATAPGAIPPPEWMEVSADYPRYLHHVRRVNLQTVNTGTEDVIIGRRLLRTEHFEPLPAVEDRRSTVWAGRQVDIQAGFGTVVDCDDPGPLQAWVEYDISTASEPAARRAVFSLDPAPLDEIRRVECARLAIAEAVDIRFEQVAAGPAGLEAVIAFTRQGGNDEQIRVEGMLGSVIFAMSPGGVDPGSGVVGVLPPGQAMMEIPVRMEVARCDAHAVSQSTKTYELSVWVAVGDEDAQAVPVPVERDLRDRLDTMLDECLGGEG